MHRLKRLLRVCVPITGVPVLAAETVKMSNAALRGDGISYAATEALFGAAEKLLHNVTSMNARAAMAVRRHASGGEAVIAAIITAAAKGRGRAHARAATLEKLSTDIYDEADAVADLLDAVVAMCERALVDCRLVSPARVLACAANLGHLCRSFASINAVMTRLLLVPIDFPSRTCLGALCCDIADPGMTQVGGAGLTSFGHGANEVSVYPRSANGQHALYVTATDISIALCRGDDGSPVDGCMLVVSLDGDDAAAGTIRLAYSVNTTPLPPSLCVRIFICGALMRESFARHAYMGSSVAVDSLLVPGFSRGGLAVSPGTRPPLV